MPLIQKTVYIREEDIDKWNVIPNKALFIHDALDELTYGIQRSKKTGNVVVGKLDICKKHGIDKNLCRMMKHS